MKHRSIDAPLPLKSIAECGREERLERALMALEALTNQFGYATIEDIKDATPEQLAKFVTDVYTIAHTAPGRCGNPHLDWLKQIEEIEDAGRKANWYDPEKSLAKSKANCEKGQS